MVVDEGITVNVTINADGTQTDSYSQNGTSIGSSVVPANLQAINYFQSIGATNINLVLNAYD
jgi:hypothetical protein